MSEFAMSDVYVKAVTIADLLEVIDQRDAALRERDVYRVALERAKPFVIVAGARAQNEGEPHDGVTEVLALIDAALSVGQVDPGEEGSVAQRIDDDPIEGPIQPGRLRFERATVYIRVGKAGRDVGILVEQEDGTLRSFRVVPRAFDAVALVEVGV